MKELFEYYEQKRLEAEKILRKGIDLTKTATLVFGGRQLGKTALLHQARNLSRDLDHGKWASWVDVKGKNVSDAAMKIGDTLVNNPRERFLVVPKRKNWTWNYV